MVCGCDDGTIKVFKNEAQLFEITENTNVVQITQIGKTNLLAYSLSDGTLGVYNENVRLWRIKVSGQQICLVKFHTIHALFSVKNERHDNDLF